MAEIIKELKLAFKEYSHNYLNGLVKNYFNNSYTELVSAFTKKENFTIEQLEELKEMINNAINK